MLFALLFDGQDELIAAAPAVFQYSLGNAYWRDAYSDQIEPDEDCQTAYVEVRDGDLIDKLNSLETDDTHLKDCRQRIAQLTGPPRPGTQTRAA